MIRHRTAPRPGASLQGGSGVQRCRDRTISPGHPVIACIPCMRSHTHTHTHTHTANNRSNRSDPHAARIQHPPRHQNRRQARRTRCTLAPSTPPPAPARAASTMVKGPHHTTHNGSMNVFSESRLECRISKCRISIQSTIVPVDFLTGTKVD